MASSKRNFTDFKDFPGELNDSGYYVLPTLWHKDELDRIRKWTIHIRMIKKGDKLKGIDWNMLKEIQVPIEQKYFTDKIEDSIISEMWVETGIEGGKITRNSPTYFEEPIYKGRSNERNVFQRALIESRSTWLKKKDLGLSEKKDQKHKEAPEMYFPMLAKTFKDAEKYLTYPLYIQPKLDGVRCIIYLKNKDDINSVVAYTRTKKIFPSIDYIKELLYPFLKKFYKKTSLYLDGELYKHGKSLQEISGDSRNEKEKKDNEYHIYDCFYPDEMDMPFNDRHSLLDKFNSEINNKIKYVKEVPTFLVENKAEANKKYKDFIKQEYEGAMLRNINGVYVGNPDKATTRSNDLVKMKPSFTDEFKCVNYTEGKRGKDKGAVIWICENNGIQFNVTPKETYDERYELYKECLKNFNKKYYGRLLTVEYQDKSEDDIPLRAKAIGFRDIE
jgi:ATP-dependent DNA ligase